MAPLLPPPPKKKVATSATTSKKATAKPKAIDPLDSIVTPTFNFEDKKGYQNYGFTGASFDVISKDEFDRFNRLKTKEEKLKYAKDLYAKKFLPLVKDLPVPLQIVAGDFNFNSENPYPSLMVAAGLITPDEKVKLYTKENGTTLRNYKVSDADKQAIIDAYNADPQGFLDKFDDERRRSYAGTGNATPEIISEWNERVGETRQAANRYMSSVGNNAPTSSQSGYSYSTPDIGAGVTGFKVLKAPNIPGGYDKQKYDPITGTYNFYDPKTGKSTPIDLDEFMNRQSGIIKNYQGGPEKFKADILSKDVTVRDPAVEWFQRQHQAIEKKIQKTNPDLKLHFEEGEYKEGVKNPRLVDKKFGIHTFSAPGYQYEETPAAPIEVKDTPEEVTESPDIQYEHIDDSQLPDYAPWWLQDQIAIAGDVMDKARIKKYRPWQATPDVDFVEPTFYDPTRELAANAEAANIAAQTAQAFTNPAQATAAALAAQGQLAKSNADVLGRYNTMNVQAANQAEMANTSIYNQASANKAALDTQLYDKYTIANQQFDNSRNQARQKLRQDYINAITNRQMTANLNELYPQYAVDPSTGGRMFFRDPKEFKAAAKTKDLETLYKDYMKIPGARSQDALQLAKIKAGIPDTIDPYNVNPLARFPYYNNEG